MFVKGEQAKYVMEIKPTWSSIVGELFFKTSFIVKMSNKKNLKRRGILKLPKPVIPVVGTRFFSFFYHRAVAIRAFSETPFALRAIELEYGILAKKTYEILLIPPPLSF